MREFRDLIRENWGLKLVSILLAVTLWLAVHGDPGTEKTITVPVEIHNLPRYLEITSERPNSVQVTIRGSSAGLWFSQTVPVCVIDLSDAEEGERVVPLGADNLRVPRGHALEVIAVRPVRINLTLERVISKEVPVVPLLTGDPAGGYEVYAVSHSPMQITITGPRTRVEKIQEVSTESISIHGRRESLQTQVNLNIRDNLVHSSPAGQVELKVEIGVRRKRLTVNEVPVLPDDRSLIVSPSRISIQVLVPETFAGNLTPADFNATVSARKLDLTLPTVRIKPDVTFAHPVGPGMSVEDIRPPMVTVRRVEKSD